MNSLLLKVFKNLNLTPKQKEDLKFYEKVYEEENYEAFELYSQTIGETQARSIEERMGLTEEEMTDNASLWAEENDVKQKTPTKSSQLRTGGVTQSGIASDLDNLEDLVDLDGNVFSNQPNCRAFQDRSLLHVVELRAGRQSEYLCNIR